MRSKAGLLPEVRGWIAEFLEQSVSKKRGRPSRPSYLASRAEHVLQLEAESVAEHRRAGLSLDDAIYKTLSRRGTREPSDADVRRLANFIQGKRGSTRRQRIRP
jgi:hypothetical protein